MKEDKMIRKALKATLPVLAGYLVLGMGFGMVMHEKGFGLIPSAAMSLLVYAGSLQYAAVSLLAEGASFLTLALTALLVNARHLFYGFSMTERYRDAGPAKPYLIFGLTDETYSLLCCDPGFRTESDRRSFYFYVTLLDHLYWITGTVLGSLLTAAVRINTKGVDFALTALFLTVVIDQWRSTAEHLPALLGIGLTFLSLLLFGRDDFLLPAMALILTALLLLPQKAGKEAGHE